MSLAPLYTALTELATRTCCRPTYLTLQIVINENKAGTDFASNYCYLGVDIPLINELRLKV